MTINFERQPNAISIFDKDLDPKRIVQALRLLTQQHIEAEKTLIFLDEIQEAPRALLALRYFYEEYQALHVIAAGSLLDFVIEQVDIPVGRVSFLYLYPMSFLEFLIATERKIAVEK